jgi:hypothetical protein
MWRHSQRIIAPIESHKLRLEQNVSINAHTTCHCRLQAAEAI